MSAENCGKNCTEGEIKMIPQNNNQIYAIHQNPIKSASLD